MYPYLRFFLSFIALFSVGCASTPILEFSDSPYRSIESLSEGDILHITTGIELSEEALMDLLAEKRVVYVGESHTNLNHHRLQLAVLKALALRHPGRLALGMEMFNQGAQVDLDRFIAGEIGEREFQKLWYENWASDYEYYREIMEFARQEGIPVIGLNATDQMVMAYARKGLEGLPDDLKEAVPEMDANDPFHRQSVEAVYQGHMPTGKAGKKAFDRFYQTMLLWDETMAQTVVDYLSHPNSQDRVMMVMAGGFHVGYGFGIPRRVFRRLPVSYAVLLPHTDKVPDHMRMDVVPPSIPLYVADFVWKTEFEDIPEGARLGVMMEMKEKGVTVLNISPDSSAAQAGIRKGDVIVSFDGEKIRETFDLSYLVRKKQWGDEVILKILRDGESLDLPVTFQAPSTP